MCRPSEGQVIWFAPWVIGEAQKNRALTLFKCFTEASEVVRWSLLRSNLAIASVVA
jgi:hypothetical protein